MTKHIQPSMSSQSKPGCTPISGRDCNSKELPTISLVYHTYTLYKSMIMNRITPTIELHLIKEHAGFTPGKSFTSQLLNIALQIQDGYLESIITGTSFVDMSAAKHIVNQIL